MSVKSGAGGYLIRQLLVIYRILILFLNSHPKKIVVIRKYAPNDRYRISFIKAYRLYSVQKLLYSRHLSKNLIIKIFKIIILPVVVYGYETLFHTLR